MKLTPAMIACLSYYRDNERNPDRCQRPPYAWTMRQANKALDRDWLMVGPGGWHILTDLGRRTLSEQSPAPSQKGLEHG